MSITGMDIQQKGLAQSMRGYNVDQVDEFLEFVANEVDALNAENAELRAALEKAKTEAASKPVTDSHELEEAVARAQRAEAIAADAEAKASAAAAEQVRAADARTQAANEKIAELQRKLEEKSGEDSAIAAAFISAQRAADNLKEEARAEGERIYRESEAKAREFIREALIEKQRILNEIDALTVSCNNFRAEYKAMMARFSAEADHLSEIEAPIVTEAAVDAILPDFNSIEAQPIDEIPAMQTEEPMKAVISEDEYDIEEID